jgi:hypothetical protein
MVWILLRLCASSCDVVRLRVQSNGSYFNTYIELKCHNFTSFFKAKLSYVSFCWIFHSWTLFGFPFYVFMFLFFDDSKCCKLWIIVSKKKCLFEFSWSCYSSGWFPCCGYFWPFLLLSKCLYVKFYGFCVLQKFLSLKFLEVLDHLVLLLISFHELWCLLWHWLRNTSWGKHITTTH